MYGILLDPASKSAVLLEYLSIVNLNSLKIPGVPLYVFPPFLQEEQKAMIVHYKHWVVVVVVRR